jgi:hypothetical protein
MYITEKMSVCPSVYIFEMEEEEEKKKKKNSILVRVLPGRMHLGLKTGSLCPAI